MTKKLEDYRPYPFEIPSIELDFLIEEDYVLVKSSMNIRGVETGITPLVLQGLELKLIYIAINGKELEKDSYEKTSTELIIYEPPVIAFDLELKVVINPFKNSSLEGLYLSGGMLTSQCEAEGFRRICFHPDRPDVLSKYIVRIEADVHKYPSLLSNGDLISSSIKREDSSRHISIWEDPYPKPSYLFAIVAGCLLEVNSKYRTISGKEVLIRIHVENQDQFYVNHAIESLKKAMRWDEDVYGLEYDLSEYNIVAVRHFNMGAMENKSLNIFNSKLILAETEMSTDYELERIESVVAHEYFHNWTGNRITCRDWFQLSLKEGLTVFRDQSFTSDLHSLAVKRIADVDLLRTIQFREDSGPTSHAVKPTKYQAIDNFYTTTIYEKGAELIRMLKVLLGEDRFMTGIRNYINCFDGSAATTEDFVQALSEGACANGESLGFEMDQFNRWYYQSGTPEVSVRRDWDSKCGKLTLYLEQKLSDQNEVDESSLKVIPILVAVISTQGRISQEKLIVLDQRKQQYIFEDLTVSDSKPSVSLFRGFSSPVRWNHDLSNDELFLLYRSDDDYFSRWNAGQILMLEAISSRSSGKPSHELEEELLATFKYIINEQASSPDLDILHILISLPDISKLENAQQKADPIRLYKSLMSFQAWLGSHLSEDLFYLIGRCEHDLNNLWPEGQGARKITGLAWAWLAAAGNVQVRKDAVEFVRANSMTLARMALEALKPIDCQEREEGMVIFYERWRDRSVILDSWFYLKSSTPSIDALDQIEKLLNHPLFDPMAPNAVRAVLGGLASNTTVFHSIDGSGYNFMADQIVQLDSRNQITASRMLKVFSRWRDYVEPNRNAMHKALIRISDADLSVNTREVIDLIL